MTFTLGPDIMLGDRYRLVERVALGGQGEVWRAEDTALGRPVAVKVLRVEYADSTEFHDRFLREARHAAALSHPGVAQVFDFDGGRDGAPPYLVMEFVDGEPLSATIAREAPMSADRVLDVIVAAGSALAAAHAAGLVHRDVKPGNLLVGRDGSIKITDFGIARAADAVPLTRTGVVLGTPLYLAPEQAMGRPATAATDLYALGVIAFEMLTGHPPFEGPATAVLVAHRDAPLPPLPPSVPSGLRDLVLALTRKDPAQRPRGAAEVVAAAMSMRSPVAEPGTTRLDGPAAPPVPGGSPGSPTSSASPAPFATAGPPPEGARPGGETRVLTTPLPAGPPRRSALLAGGALAFALVAGLAAWAVWPSGGPPPGTGQQPAVSATPTPTASEATTQAARRPPAKHRKPRPRVKGHKDGPRKHKGHGK